MAKAQTFEWLARAGYVARGVVFLLTAGLALFSTLGARRPETKSALDTLLGQPLGRIWLTLIAIGLLGFVAWRLAQAVANADHHERGAKGGMIRLALFGSAIAYIGLSLYAFSHAWGLGYGRGEGEKGLASWAMAQPFGAYLAAAIGLGFVIGGGITIFKGVSRNFERYLNLADRRPLTLICVYGLVSRGILFAIVGILFCYAAFTVDPDKAGSMGDALAWLRSLPFGAVLYAFVALGLAAFGFYNFVEARYRIIQTPDAGTIPSKLPV